MLTAGQVGMEEEWQNSSNIPAVSTSLPFPNSELYYNRIVANPTERQVGFWNRDYQRNGILEGLNRNSLASESSLVYPHENSLSPKVSDRGSGWSLSSLDWTPNEMDDGTNTVISSLASLDDEHRVIQEGISYSWSGTSSVSADNTYKHFPYQITRKVTFSSIVSKTSTEDLKMSEKSSSFANSQETEDFSSSFAEKFAEKATLSDSPPLDALNESKKDENKKESASKLHKTEYLNTEKGTQFQDIDSILPDDEDLMAGMLGYENISQKYEAVEEQDDAEDVFISGGGLELETEASEKPVFGFSSIESLAIPMSSLPATVSSGQAAMAGEHPFGEHPSRTLFVRNINSNVEDSELRSLFEQYGDIRTLYTACKHRGFVMISYYDIRSARSAMRALQNKPLRRRKLDIHFSIPKDNPSDKDINQGTLVVFNLDSSVSNEDLRNIFGAYGEVKEIRETPHKKHHKFIEFYDVRAAESALKALNRSDIAGKRIKLEPSRPGGARRSLIQQLTAELEQEESRPQCQLSTNSSPPHLASSPWNSFPSSHAIDSSSLPHSNPLQSSSFDTSLPNHFTNSLPQSQTSSTGMGGTIGLPPYSASSIRKFSTSSSFNSLQNQLDQTNLLNQTNVFSSSVPNQNLGSGMNHEAGALQAQFGTIGMNRNLVDKINSDTFVKSSSVNNIDGYFDSFYENNGTVPNQPTNQRSTNNNSPTTLSSSSLNQIWNSHVFASSLPSTSSPWSSSIEPFYPSNSPSHHSNHSLDPFPQPSRNYHAFHAYNRTPSSSLYSNLVGSDPQQFNRHYSFLGESPDLTSHSRSGSLGSAGSIGSNLGYSATLNVNGYLQTNTNSSNSNNMNHNTNGNGNALHLSSRDSMSMDNYSVSQVRGFSQSSYNDGSSLESMNLHSPNFVSASDLRARLFAQNNSMAASLPFPSAENFAERGRGKRNESVYPDSKKQYALDLEKIMKGEDSRTTLMIKNIPNKYTQKMLLSAIDENHRGTYDFFYLPIDFKNKCNVGYAFINMVEPTRIIPFYEAFNGKKWEKFNSEKVASLAYARIQGKHALVAHFQNSSLMNEDKRCRPVLFHTQGPLQGDQEPFPVGMNVRLRPTRERLPNGMGIESNHGSPSNLSCGSSREDSGHGGSFFLAQTNASQSIPGVTSASFLRSLQDFASLNWKEEASLDNM